jgi:hypothetical protein
MESSKLSGEAVELWGEGHAFANGASGLTDRAYCRSTPQIFQRFFPQAKARTVEMWKPSSKRNPD